MVIVIYTNKQQITFSSNDACLYCICSIRHKNPCLTYKFWEVRQPATAFVVKFSKPGADDPWYNVCVWVVNMHVYCMLVVSVYSIFSIQSVCMFLYSKSKICNV